MKTSDSVGNASALIDERIEGLGDWRGEMLAKVRKIILKADPEIIEEWKWGTPVWSRRGIICTGEAYKKTVKTTFAKGAALSDPSGLFNSSLEGNVRRAIDFSEGAKVNEAALTALIRAAVAHNLKGKSDARASGATRKEKSSPTPKGKTTAKPRTEAKLQPRAKSQKKPKVPLKSKTKR